MTQTSNYNLNKFQSTDKMNPTTLNGLNDNADKIDTALAGLNTNKQGKIAEPLTADLNLIDGSTPTGLVSGKYYFTGSYHVKINGTTQSAFDNVIFYYVVTDYGDNEYDYTMITITQQSYIALINAYTDASNPTQWTGGTPRGILTVNSISTSKPTDPSRPQYDRYVPSTKLFYTEIGNVESVLQTLNSGNGVS